jgi:radical SAM superfamily enzyme YgiQ (UPF0313 family)
LSYIRPLTSAKIVVGGAGAVVRGDNVSTSEVYGKLLKKQSLIDHYIHGEGELPWRALLGNILPYPGIDCPGEVLSNFDFVPSPDYSGYKLTDYINSKVNGLTLGAEGSRGCVRDCTFCDVKSFWQKYKFKDGQKLAQELVYLKEIYQVKHFFFNDSLVNGSDKAFRIFIKELSDYNQRNPHDPIHWSGYYIIKPKTVYKEQDWINLKNSGARSLYIGIESGSEQVRNHMKKKFSNADIDHTMHYLQRYGIRCTWLMIIGYPTETEEDFQATLDLLKKYQPMALDSTIDTVALGVTLSIIPDSPLGKMVLKQELGIHAIINDYDNSIYWKNTNSDFKTRLKRRIQAEELVRELGYNSWVGDMDQVEFFKQKLLEIEAGIINTVDIMDNHG